MADYYGLKAIARRMGVASEGTIHRWHRNEGFLMYRRHRFRLKAAWYTNDSLIAAWELSRCRLHHAEDARRREMLKAQVTA